MLKPKPWFIICPRGHRWKTAFVCKLTESVGGYTVEIKCPDCHPDDPGLEIKVGME